jgi:hypothetical protein
MTASKEIKSGITEFGLGLSATSTPRLASTKRAAIT